MDTTARQTAAVLGVRIDRLDMEGTIRRVEEIIAQRTPSQHLAVSVTNLVAIQDDPWLRTVAEEAEIVSADGLGVVWASRLLGDALPERVNAMDLMERLFEVAERKGYRIFVLGARQDALERAISRIRERHPNLTIAGYRNGYFDESEDEEVVAEIRGAAADMLFVAISSPKKEYWLARYKDELGVPFVMGVGGAVDVLAGLRRRAPLVVQRAGLEWAFRMLQEPRRLGRRFLVGNAKFVYRLGRALASGRGSAGLAAGRGDAETPALGDRAG